MMPREMLAGARALRRVAWTVGCLPVLCGAAPPLAPLQTVPAYLASATGCALVVGGAFGSEFADANVTAFWDEVNARIAARMLERLSAQGYKTASLALTRQDKSAEDVIALAAARARCNRLIQVAHEVSEDARGRYFRYDITVIRLSPTEKPGTGGGTSVVAVGEFARSYRYARTPAVLETFSAEAFARRVAADLRSSGRLAGLK